MSLVKALILTSVLDPTVSIEALLAAFSTVEATEAEATRRRVHDRPPWGDGGLDPRDALARDIVVACST